MTLPLTAALPLSLPAFGNAIMRRGKECKVGCPGPAVSSSGGARAARLLGGRPALVFLTDGGARRGPSIGAWAQRQRSDEARQVRNLLATGSAVDGGMTSGIPGKIDILCEARVQMATRVAYILALPSHHCEDRGDLIRPPIDWSP